MLHGLYWLAANFASRRPALLVVDDLHWADEPSLALARVSRPPARRAPDPAACRDAATRAGRHSVPCHGGAVRPRQRSSIRPGKLRPGVRCKVGARAPRSRARPDLRRRPADGIRRQPALPGRASGRPLAGGDQSDRGPGVRRARARATGDCSRDRLTPCASARRGGAALARGGDSRRSNRAIAGGRASRPRAESRAECRERARTGRPPQARESARVHPSGRSHRRPRGHERRRTHQRAPSRSRNPPRARSAPRTGGHLPRRGPSRQAIRLSWRRCDRRRSGRLRRVRRRRQPATSGARSRSRRRTASAPTCSATSVSPRRTAT